MKINRFTLFVILILAFFHLSYSGTTPIALISQDNLAVSGSKTSGLKELLNIGIKNAISIAGIKDGFYLNDLIRIPLPKKLKKIDALIRRFGGKRLSDALIEKMNRAAEQAVPLSLNVFVNAIKEIKFTDVLGLIGGKEHSITKFLELKTSDSLKKSFFPIVEKTMEEVQAINTYNKFIKQYKSNPFTKLLGLDIDINQYVTGKAIDGLFILIANEEKKIRVDPASRVTDLLKSIFTKKK